jgi:hypothetical protein
MKVKERTLMLAKAQQSVELHTCIHSTRPP